MIKYAAKISQDSTNDPGVQVIESIFPVTCDWTYGGTPGRLVGTFSEEVVNTSMPQRWYNADSQGGKYVVNCISQTQIEVAAYDNAGNPSDAIMSSALVEMENTGAVI